MDKQSFYITTTIPYVNADPHIGFALELVQADAIARYQRLSGHEVFFTTGTDEHGQKIWEASHKEGKDVQEYVDYYANIYLGLKDTLNLSNDSFIRTTDPNHLEAAQEIWRLCDQKGDIYKKKYKGLYCVGCEKFITEKDLINGKCEFHPTLTPELVEEENYFFRISEYREKLLAYLANPESILPEWRRQEAIEFVKENMEDFSISRSKERFSWGVAIPGDTEQVMYVWFDAFVNYISSLGWPQSKEKFEKFWQNGYRVQTAGKDMVKFQSVMWQGMLMSAGLPTTDTVVYHGFITGEGGIRMSKSIGNVVNPIKVAEEYGADALRYFLLREISPFEDSPFTMERFKDAYNSGLANGLGNLTSRIMKMAISYGADFQLFSEQGMKEKFELYYAKDLQSFNIKKVLDEIWLKVGTLDKKIAEEKPFELFKNNPEKARMIVSNLVMFLDEIGLFLEPFLPETSEKIRTIIRERKMPEKPLFLRRD